MLKKGFNTMFIVVMASFRLARDLLLGFDDGEISGDDFLLLYDLSRLCNLKLRIFNAGNKTTRKYTY